MIFVILVSYESVDEGDTTTGKEPTASSEVGNGSGVRGTDTYHPGEFCEVTWFIFSNKPFVPGSHKMLVRIATHPSSAQKSRAFVRPKNANMASQNKYCICEWVLSKPRFGFAAFRINTRTCSVCTNSNFSYRQGRFWKKEQGIYSCWPGVYVERLGFKLNIGCNLPLGWGMLLYAKYNMQ